MSEVYSKIYKLIIYMQEMKSSFKLSEVKTVGFISSPLFLSLQTEMV